MVAFQNLNQCGHELISMGKSSNETTIILQLLDRVNKNWQAVAVHLINHRRKFDEVVKYSEKYHATKQPLLQWFEKIETRVTTLSQVAVQTPILLQQLGEQKVRKNIAGHKCFCFVVDCNVINLIIFLHASENFYVCSRLY